MYTEELPMPVAAASLGWAAGCSRPGAAHQRSGSPCQDAYALWSGAVAGTPCLVAAVADGHGDARHDRSQRGAALAVYGAVEVAREFCLAYGEAEALDALKHDFKTHFPRRLGQRWHEAVRQDAQTQDTTVFTRYGTTLLVAVVVPGTLLVGQIGDGALLWVTEQTCHLPFQISTTLLGTETHSLCSLDASQLWQTSSMEHRTAGLLLLTTYGLTDALGEESLMPFARSLEQRLREFGPVQVAAALPTWLDHYSQHGSGDDMTVALLWLAALPANVTPTTPSHSAEESQHELTHRSASCCGNTTEHPDGQTETR